MATDPQDEALSLGLDIGGTKVHGALVSFGGPQPLVRFTARRPTAHGVSGVVDSAAAVVAELLAAAGLTIDRLGAVGVGVPGIVDPVTAEVSHAVNLGIEGSAPLGALLAERLGVEVRVDNDLNVAALGAARVMAGDEPADLAYLALGTGVAAGLVLDGRVRRGASGAAGEIGHVPVVPDGRACPCGQRGCLEQYASGSALDAAWPSRTGRPAPVELLEAASGGDPVAVAVLDEFAAAVASAVRLLVLTCDMRQVVLGGGVSALGEPLLRAVRAALEEQAAASPFLRAIGLAERVTLAPAEVPLAAVGAALLGGGPVGGAEPGADPLRGAAPATPSMNVTTEESC
ncbi:ROK family protein [Actinotalea sp.]|uniref:ROK family protein n=1 Tax=Actinotalea sp. TaxID=1872145 RepID=UPI003564407D